MNKTLLLALCLVPLVVACQPAPSDAPAADTEAASAAPAAAPASLDPVARGQYLVTAMACNDCHTPWVMGPEGPHPDATRLLSGHPEEMAMPAPPTPAGPWTWSGAATNTAFAGPWGVSFAANLTPDPSGLAAWDKATFVAALRSGKHFGQSRPILPPMPWPSYSKLTDEDLGAIFAYLQSIPPIANHVPDPVPPPEAEQTAGAGGP
jgi:hypothetical protein